ncbi:sensor histidine kinase [Streptosporangium sp. NPDC002607]
MAAAAARIAWSWCALTLVLTVLAVVLAVLNGTNPLNLSHLLFVAACALAGGLIGSRRPEHGVGRLLTASAFCFALMEFCGQYAILGLVTRPGLPLAEALAWPQTWLWVPANLSACLIPLFFPDGRLPSAGARRLAIGATAAGAVTMVAGAFRPGENSQVAEGGGVVNPLGVAGLADVAPVVETAMTALFAVVFFAGALDLGVRALRSGGRERRQVAWLVYAVGIEAVVVAARLAAGLTDDVPGSIWPMTNTPWELAGGVGVTLLPVAICVAILRHRLFDIDLVINRTLVYALLSGCVTGGYVVVVGYLGALFPTGDLPISILAAGLVALAFAPLREWLRGWVNLLMYGERDDPYAALTRLGRRLESTAEPGTVLPGVARSVAEALRLPYAAVETAGGARYASGTPAGELVRLPLTHNGERAGDLILSPRPGESGFGPRDLRVLGDLARQISVAVHAVRLSADLRRSRERLVMAREEERRRLRRDLHDGLGPTLAALTMRAEAVHDLVEDEHARRLLAEIVSDAEAAVADVRTLVDGLRPPALDSLGLLGALRAHTIRQPAGLRVALRAPDGLPPLPAATEVAAYRIASEALANVRRHAGATRAELRIEMADGTLRLEVSDDGRGMRREAPVPDGPGGLGRAGVGLASMRERAVELGGSCVFEEHPGGGTLVRVVLPAAEEGGSGDPDPAG